MKLLLAAVLLAQVPTVSFIGSNSRIETRRYERHTDQKSFAALWIEHTGDKKALAPEVDFKRCMVVAAFDGKSWNSNGVYVVSIDENKERVRVRIDERTYQTSGLDGGGVRVTPFGIFILDRSTKPLVLEENVQNLIGGEPKWKERARFPKLP